MNVEQARYNMIEQQIRTWDVLDQGVLSLLAAVRREDFVPPSCRSIAFFDTEVPLPEGQKMLAPRVEARLLQELQVQRHESVLEIGAGSGFMAALLGHRAQRVLSLERRPALARFAAENVRRAGVRNVEVREADGSSATLAESPFDVILLSGSVSSMPASMRDRLKAGGRLAAIVGHEPVMRAVLCTRGEDGGFAEVDLFDTVAPRLDGFGEPPRFRF